jgi:hypothetical protein
VLFCLESDMHDILLEQALCGFHPGSGYRFLGRSPGFSEEWLPLAEHLCAGFGERPRGVACPASLFVQPFGKRHVVVVQVADQGIDAAGQPSGLGFHLLVLSRSDYVRLGGDPFLIADRFRAPWTARRELPTLSWVGEPTPRTVAQIQRVLQRPEDGPNLLGASQILVDGGRLVFERALPDNQLMRDLWALLPTNTRCELWPATFAFGNALGFHVFVTPRALADTHAGYIRGEQAGDYPEGRYELNLQIAAESGDQGDLDALLARRSLKETWRLGLLLVAVCVVLAILGNLLVPVPRPGELGPRPAPRKGPSADHRAD